MKRKSSKKRRIIIFGAVVVLLIVFMALIKGGVLGGVKPMEVGYVYAQRRSITQLTTATGRIQPVAEVKISPEVSGEIIELPVIEGQRVERGTLLCRIKPDTYISARDRTSASLSSSISRANQADNRLALQKQSFERAKQLYENHAISQAEFESAQAEYNVAKDEASAAHFAVASTKASLNEATELLSRTTIYSPTDGNISKLNVELGERVVGTAQMAGTELMRLANLDNMEARVNVSESDIANVHLRDTAIISVDAYPDTTFRGVVTQIASSSNTVTSADQITNFEVRILLLPESYQWLRDEKGAHPFKPGMSVSVDIMTKRVTDVLSLPIEAVSTRSAKSEGNENAEGAGGATKPYEVVFIARGDTACMQRVTTGIQDANYIELVTPLDDSARVIVSPYSAVARELSDKTFVKAHPEKKRSSR